jgi:hypothetical protein
MNEVDAPEIDDEERFVRCYRMFRYILVNKDVLFSIDVNGRFRAIILHKLEELNAVGFESASIFYALLV